MTKLNPHTIVIGSNEFETILETTQCIWEAVENMLINAKWNEPIERIRSVVGTPEIRGMFRKMDLLNACNEGWELIEATNGGCMIPYDFEYVPWFVEECMDYDTEKAKITLRDDWKAICLNKATE